jgi:hypothetical protein
LSKEESFLLVILLWKEESYSSLGSSLFRLGTLEALCEANVWRGSHVLSSVLNKVVEEVKMVIPFPSA